jgi:hypothetical protein
MSIRPVLLELDRVLAERNALVYNHLRSGLDSDTIENKLAVFDIESQDLLDFYTWHNGVEWDGAIRNARRWLFGGPRFLQDEFALACAQFHDWEELSSYRPQLKGAIGTLFPVMWNAAASWLALNIDPNSASFGGVYVIDLDAEIQVRRARPSIREFFEEIVNSIENDSIIEL